TSAQYSGCSYSAVFGAWSPWSSTCSASATRTRSVSCRRSDGTIVGNSECTGRGVALTPTSETSAQYGSCSYTPEYGSWSSCSGGTQTRSVACRRSTGHLVPSSYCGLSGSPTTQSQTCVNNAWHEGEWSSYARCTTAGLRTRTRAVYCRASDGSTVPDSQCDG